MRLKIVHRGGERKRRNQTSGPTTIQRPYQEIRPISKSDLEKTGVYKNPIVTEITPFKDFYVAGDCHKNYYESHRDAPYCNFVIDPKMHKLIAKYRNDLKDKSK